MRSHTNNYLWIIITIIVAGLFVTFATARLAARAERDSLAARSSTIAAGFSPRAFDDLSGTEADIDLPGSSYGDLKATLTRIREANADIRFVYVLGRRDDDVFFYADSEDPSSEDYSAPGDVYDEVSQEIYGSFDTGAAFVEGPVSDRWGTWISGIAPIKDADGSVAGVVGIDIAARSYYQNIAVASSVPALLMLIAVLLVAAGYRNARKNEELARIKSRFLSVASHELRSPLAGVVWGTESLLRRRDELDEKTKQMISKLHASAVYMSETVNDILDTSRFNAVVQNRVQREAVDLAELVRSVASVLALTGEQRGISITFDASFPERIPLVFDKEKIRRVFANIIGNALKYSNPGGIVTISYEHKALLRPASAEVLADKQGSGGQASEHIITVVDHGIGIPLAEQGRIFTTYYRATNAQKHDARGTGMGLHFVKQLLELHGGRIWFESKEGEGTRVYVGLKA